MKHDRPLYCPFTILVDTAESQPFEFKGIRSDAKDGNRIWRTETRRVALGRHPNSLGDYSIEGHTGRVAIERKSIEDVQSTVLGWSTRYETDRSIPGRRERFESELNNLSQIDAPLVVVEGSLGRVLETMPSHGKKSEELNQKMFARFLLRFWQDPEFRVPWVWCDTRRQAEVFAFRWLYRYFRKAK